jgi:Arc/MetJ family transcription regulator
MGTNLQLDDSLIVEAMRLGRHRTKKATVTRALEDEHKAREPAEHLPAATIGRSPSH